MIISFVFIFLLALSVVSASIMDTLKDFLTPGKEKIPVSNKIKSPPPDIQTLPPPTDTENGFGGGCELLEEEETFLGLGEESFINEHVIFLDEDGGLLIDDTYYYPELKEGGSYLVPIPNPECYWEAYFDGGELSMYTVCPLPEEPIV